MSRFSSTQSHRSQVLCLGFASLPRSVVTGPRSCEPTSLCGHRSQVFAMADKNKSIEMKIIDHIHTKYLGNKDIEITDSVDFCEYFERNYSQKPDDLKAMFQKIETDLCSLGWNPKPAITHVVGADPDDVPSFLVAPWQLGLTEAHSVKGKSKLVNIMDTVDGFLKKPYASVNDPLQVLFAPGSQVGAVVLDWSMVMSIGMGKGSASRMILEAVSVMNLSFQDIETLAPKLRALLRMRCTYDPAPTEEAQLDKAFADKNRVVMRPRPDPLMMAIRWNNVITKQGLHFASVIDEKLKKFNSDKSEGFGVLDHEVCFIKAYPHQAQEYIDIWRFTGRTSDSVRVRSHRRDSLSLTSPRKRRSSVARRPTCCSTRSSLGPPQAMCFGFCVRSAASCDLSRMPSVQTRRSTCTPIPRHFAPNTTSSHTMRFAFSSTSCRSSSNTPLKPR